MDTHSPNTITEKKQKGKKMNYGKPNKEKFNEATKLIEKNAERKEEKMTTDSQSPFYFEVAVAECPDVERFNNYADAVSYCDRNELDYEFIIKRPNTITEKKEEKMTKEFIGYICVDGMFDYMTINYYNKLTKKEKEGIDYEYYKQNKHKSTDFIDYYEKCMEKRKEEEEETDKEKVIKRFNLEVGDKIKLGQCRGGGIATIKKMTEKSIILKDSTSRLTFKSIVKNNYEDIDTNLGEDYE